jgi:hypothetical protein
MEAYSISEYEQKLIRVIRRLPTERLSQLVDFAEFLEFQMTRIEGDELGDEEKSPEEIGVDNARWDALLATDASQRMLEKMADNALAEIEAGHAKPMAFTEDGQLIPG